MLSFPPLPGIRLPKKSVILPTVLPIEFVRESNFATDSTFPVSRFEVSLGLFSVEVVVFFKPEQEESIRRRPNAAIDGIPQLLLKKRG